MKTKLKIQIITIALLLSGNVFSQKSKNSYTTIKFKIEGDLNNDNISDLVIVTEDSSNKYHPCLLEIKFGTESGPYKSVFTSEKAVMEKQHYIEEIASLDNLEIKKGILIFTNGLIRGVLIHKFRFQNGNFELIGYGSNQMLPGYIQGVDFNLSTGKKIYKTKDWQTNKTIEKQESEEIIYPLPKLQDFTPLDFVY